MVAAASFQALHSELRGAAMIHVLKVLALVTALQPAEHAHEESVAGLLGWLFWDANVSADIKLQRTIAGPPRDCHYCPDSGMQSLVQQYHTALMTLSAT